MFQRVIKKRADILKILSLINIIKANNFCTIKPTKSKISICHINILLKKLIELVQ